MNMETIGFIGLALLVCLIFSRMLLGPAMTLVGFIGFVVLTDLHKGFAVLATVPFNSVAFYPLSAIPLFVLMGVIVTKTGLSQDIYDSAHKWIGRQKGGLAMATILACAGFAAITGSSIAGGITMGKIALPEMRRHEYHDVLATSCIAAGGTLGILIPPSMGFILYGILTEESIGKLFMAGIIPGILLTILFIMAIKVITILNPAAGPRGPKSNFISKLSSLKNTWPILFLFLLILGGIYLGFFTPTEAGAIGAFGAIVITSINRRLTWRGLYESLNDAVNTTAMLILMIVGAFILMRFLTISGITELMAEAVRNLTLSRYAVLSVIVFFYICLGMFLEIMTCMVVTIPIIHPLIMALGFDPIWFGVVLVLLMEMGLITPPIGMNVFALSGVTGVPVGTIFKGVWPFVISMVICTAILTVFPGIVLFLPNLM